MRKPAWAAIVAMLALTAPAAAQNQTRETFDSIYAPPEIAGAEQGVNEGGVNFELNTSFMTDYIWRGIDRSESGGREDATNLQVESRITWDLGKWPRPFLGVFTNVYEDDPLSRFQEIRPFFGLELTARPIIFTVGHTNYIFPDRDDFNAREVWAQIKLDDSYFFRTDDPVFSPYVFAAYDYDTNNGVYIEFGISHDFQIEDTPLTITPRAAVAYVDSHRAFRLPPPGSTDPSFDQGSGDDSGFQHYRFGVEATYRMNELLNIPSRYGRFDLKGYLFFTEGIDDELRGDRELWGGVGIGFRY